MKNNYSSFFLRLWIVLSVFLNSQAKAQVLPPKCGSAILHDRMMQTDPAYVQKMQMYEMAVQMVQNQAQRTMATVYKIPVVVHVMHKGEPVGSGTNVSDVAIENAIRSLNEIYRKVAGSRGDGNGVDTEIEFALAVRDPSGNCTNGIVRVNMTGNTTYMNNGVYAQSSGITESSLKATSVWTQTKYYNIWLVSEIDNNSGGTGIQGYAYFASSHGTALDGAVMLANNFIGGTSTTCAHELGHALNLYHTFEGGTTTTCPPVTNGCGSGQGDCCADVPPHKQSQSDCNTGTNSCNGGSPNDLFIHNYMDYSSDVCQNMFTANQKTRMITALTTTRASFLTPENGGTNNALTPVSAPVADFDMFAQVSCGTGQISLLDKTNCVANSYIAASSYPNVTYTWTVTNGTNTFTSNVQNPVINITNAGTYSITLSVTNALGTNSITKPNVLIVPASGPVTACTPSSSNSGNTGQTICDVQFNNINAPSATIGSAAYTDLTCTKNTTVTAGSIYPLKISALGLGYTEYFEVYIDYNNNGVFTNPGELIFSGSSPVNVLGTYTANITIPTTATQNTLLRMRVMGEANAAPTAAKRSCSSAFFVGDVEDYGVYIKPVACSAPSVTATNGASRCGAGTASINATASAGTTNWYTASTGGTAVATGTAYTIPSVTTTTTYYVDATNSGCTTPVRTAVTVTVNAVPVLTITPNSTSICVGGTTTLTASGATTYTWLPSGSGTTNVVSPSSTTIYTVTGSSASCTATAVNATVTVGTVPVLTITPTTTTICSGANVTLTASGATTYTWLPSGSGATNNVSPATTTIYTVTGSNGGCTSAAKTATVTVTSVPVVTITPTNTTICAGGTTTLTASGATTYTWLPSGSGTNNVVNPSSTTIYTLTGTSSGCVSAAKMATVTVNAIPVVTVSPNNPTICSGGTTTLTASGATTYTWLPSGTGATKVVNPSSTTVYTVTGSNGSCAGAPKTVTVTVNTTLALTVTPTNTTICNGSSTTLNVSGATTYTWLPSGSGSSIVVSPSSTTVYTVTGSSGSCMSSPVTTTVTVNSVPVLTITPTSTTICSGNNVTLTASGASTYTWLPSGSGANNIVSPLATTVYTVTGTSAGCVGAAKTTTVTVTAVPVVTITPNNPTICSGGTTTLTASGATTYTWLPSGTGATKVVSPSSTTVYTVTGSNGSCAGAPKTVTVTVNTTLALTVTPTNTTICNGSSTTLNVSGATTYTWLPSGSGSSIVVSPSSTTIYTVTGSSGSCASAPATTTVTVNSVPVLTVTPSNTTICNGSSATLSASGATSYTWFPGSQTTAAVSVSPTSATVYTVTGANGICSSVSTVSVNVNAVPTVTTSITNTTVCNGTPVTVSIGGAISYTWSPSGSGSMSTLTPAATTIYTINGMYGGCNSVPKTFTINVTPSPVVNISPSSSTICAGQSATLTASGAAAYTWMPGAQTTSVIVVSPGSTTGYSVTGTNAGCSTVAQAMVTVNGSSALAASLTNTSICVGTPVLVNVSGGSTYNWLPSGSGSSSTLSPSSTTIYTVTSSGTCGAASVTFTINVVPAPVINTSASSTICAGGTTTLSATGASNYTWTPVTGLSSNTGSTVSASPASSLVYTVTGSNGACEVTKTVTVSVILCTSVEAISNGTGLVVYPNPSSDLFTILAAGNMGKLNVSVLNTLGQTVMIQNSKDPEIMVLDMSAYSKGVYYLKIEMQESTRLLKVVLN